jgi:hypothetical protein
MPRGGPRPNSGRKKGSRNKRSIGIAERMTEAAGASTGSALRAAVARRSVSVTRSRRGTAESRRRRPCRLLLPMRSRRGQRRRGWAGRCHRARRWSSGIRRNDRLSRRRDDRRRGPRLYMRSQGARWGRGGGIRRCHLRSPWSGGIGRRHEWPRRSGYRLRWARDGRRCGSHHCNKLFGRRRGDQPLGNWFACRRFGDLGLSGWRRGDRPLFACVPGSCRA